MSTSLLRAAPSAISALETGACPSCASASTVKTTAAILPLAVVRGDAVEVGPRTVGAEVPARRLDEVVGQRVVPVVVDLDVHVHVDRLDGVEVDRGFVAGHVIAGR